MRSLWFSAMLIGAAIIGLLVVVLPRILLDLQ
jgi:hypothetical protein